MSYEAKDIVSLSQGRAFREKIGMYLSGDRQEAINLGLRELIVNVQDEYEVYKPSNPFIRIALNVIERTICVEDNMRGIPCSIRDDGINSLTAAMLINHSGGKHREGAYSSSVGINGCGNKIVCHTAEWLEVEVRRDGIKWYQRYESTDEGAVPVTEVENHGKYTGQTGTKITYKPDKRVYGDCFIDIDALCQMLQEMSYFTKGLKIILNVDGDENTFYSKNGLIDGLCSEQAIGKPFSYFYEQDDCKVELALQWVQKYGEIKGYANGLFMREGGAFITGFKTSLTKVFNGLFNTKFTGEQIRNMLDGFVSVKVKVGQFSNQAKTALANPEARTATSAAITNAIKEYYNSNKKELETVVAILNKIAKADAAAEKAREAILNHEKDMASARKKKVILSDKLNDARTLGEDSILLVVEGESAGGNMVRGRQASKMNNIGILKLRGKCINPYTHNLEEVLNNEEVKLLCQAIGITYGEKLDKKKLRYGKIAICVDADDDGAHIALLILSLVNFLCPEYLQQNRMCWLRSPLFKMGSGKTAKYYYSYEEFLAANHNSKEQIIRVKGLGQLEAEDLTLTMFNKENRRLEPIPYTEEGLYELLTLMGTDVGPRKEFIFNNIDFGGIKIG